MAGYTQEDLDRIRKARIAGVSRVEIRGKVTTFRSDSDMTKLEQNIAACLEAEAEGSAYVPGRRKAFILNPCR